MGVLMGECALRSKAGPNSRQINDPSVMYLTSVFICHQIIGFGHFITLSGSNTNPGVVYRAPQLNTGSLICSPQTFSVPVILRSRSLIYGTWMVEGHQAKRSVLHTNKQTDDQLHENVCAMQCIYT